MKGRHPKRRKDKYNPYTICENAGHFFISFKDGQGVLHEFEITEQIYKAFDRFELEDLVHLNIWDRHTEQSELRESTLNKRASHKLENLEDTILEKIEVECLHKAILRLSEVQRRRIVLYYFYDMTYGQIAEKENCSFQAIAKSISAAEKRIKNYLN
ncbi:hypothetical protein IMSAGC020_02302 [Lachnospiraceae bacterium]|nr:hypothetical protein IMSAGC020_02302 [Lachnospiraceae bacterium]